MKRLISSLLLGVLLISSAACTTANSEGTPNSESEAKLALKDASRLVLNRTTGYVEKINGNVTAKKLSREFSCDVTVTAPDGSVRADDDKVASDDIITAGENGESLRALIYGDVDRDAEITLGDAVATLRYLAAWSDVDVCTPAGDTDGDGEITSADVITMLRYIAGWDVSLGGVRMVRDNRKVTAEFEDPDLDIFFTSTMNKRGRSDTKSTGEYAYKMSLASNETESCQMIITTTEDKEGLTAEITPFEHEFGEATLTGTLNFEYYYEMQLYNKLFPLDRDNYTTDYYPEVILPMAESFELTAGCAQGLLVSVTTGKDTPAGMYKAAVNIKNADGQVIKTANVYAYVYGFNLPDTPYSASAFNICSYDVYVKAKIYEDPERILYSEYYEFLLDHNLSAYNLPFNVSEDAADKFMYDPRVTSFVIAGMEDKYAGEMARTDEEIVAAYNKIKDDETLFNKGYFYYTDEPYGDGLFEVRDSYNHLVELLGTTEFRNMTPIYYNKEFVDADRTRDPVEYVSKYINVWCPVSTAYLPQADGGTWSHPNAVKIFGEYYERAEAFRERGDTIWWYVCVEPPIPFANFYDYYQGAAIRVLLWQQFMNDIDGLLYFATTESWDKVSPYRYTPINHGDGLLLYWGGMFGFDEPVASWRLIQIRDGFDDFDYLRIAEELLGRDAVMEVVNGFVTTGMLEYSEDFRDIESAKDIIAEMIEFGG